MLNNFKRYIRENIFPFTSWLPRYYIFFKWAVIPKAAVVLDLACGEGYVSVKLAARCRKVVGLDISSNDLLLAEDKKSRSKFKDRIDFTLGDILKMPFAEGTFDLVVCMDALPQIERDREALAEIARVLKPGGRLVITTPWRYTCSSILFKAQTRIKKLIPRFMYRVYFKGNIKWYEADNETISKCYNIYHQYDVQGLEEKAKPFLQLAGYRYFLQKYGALATDITYGVKGLWTLRFILFWIAVRLDWYLSGNRQGYSFIAEFTKPV